VSVYNPLQQLWRAFFYAVGKRRNGSKERFSMGCNGGKGSNRSKEKSERLRLSSLLSVFLLPLRVEFLVDFAEVFVGDVGVDLGRGDGGVTEHRLH